MLDQHRRGVDRLEVGLCRYLPVQVRRRLFMPVQVIGLAAVTLLARNSACPSRPRSRNLLRVKQETVPVHIPGAQVVGMGPAGVERLQQCLSGMFRLSSDRSRSARNSACPDCWSCACPHSLIDIVCPG